MLSLRVYSKYSIYSHELSLEATQETLEHFQLLNLNKLENSHILNNTFNRCKLLTKFLHMTWFFKKKFPFSF